MTLPSRPNLQKHTRAAWRRAADELLIDAIFGSAPRVIRDEASVPASAGLPRASGLGAITTSRPTIAA